MFAFKEMGCLDIRIGVRFSHEAIADHADA
jgi:hypothetical protein